MLGVTLWWLRVTLMGVRFEGEEEMYRKYADGLIRYATVLVGPDRAHDVVADAVVGVLGGVGLSSVVNAKAYLYRAVHNSAAAMTGRSGARERREIAASMVERTRHLGEADLDVVAAVAALSPRQRAVVWLVYWDDLTAAMAAQVLGISEGSVKRHLARARASVRKALQ